MDFIDNLTDEAKLVFCLSKLSPSENDVMIAQEILSKGKYNPTICFALMFEHRVAQIVFRNMVNNNIHGKLPAKYYHILENYVGFVEYRNKKISSVLFTLFEDLNSIGMKYAPLKGTMLIHTTYNDYALRYSNDVDILIQEKDISTITEVLEKRGFKQCLYDEETASYTPATKKQKIFHRMTTHELISFFYFDDTLGFECIEVDVQFDIFNRSKNLRQQFDHEILFRELISISSQDIGTITILKPQYNVLQLASHIYQDATRIHTIRKRKDLELIKFVDLYEYITCFGEYINWDEFAAEVVMLDVQHILYYALYHVEMLYGNCVPRNFINFIKPLDLTYIETYGTEENLQIKWRENFTDRLFDFNRVKEIDNVDPLIVTETSKYYEGMDKLK